MKVERVAMGDVAMDASASAKRCLACGYDLDHLTSPCCPECGLRFDAADPDSFYRETGHGRPEDVWPLAVALIAWVLLPTEALVISVMLQLVALGSAVCLRLAQPSWLPRSIHLRLATFLGTLYLLFLGMMAVSATT